MTKNDADSIGGPNGAPGASGTVPTGGGADFGSFATDPGASDGDGDENLGSGNGAGGAAGTPEGHEGFVPG